MKFITAISTLSLVFTAFSSDETVPQIKQKMHKAQTTKLLGPLALHLVETYSKPEISMKMKMIHTQWSKLKPTGFLDLIPNESSCKVFRDMETNEIYWENPYFHDERREKLDPILQLKSAEMANGIFNFFSDHHCNFGGTPIVKGLVLLMSEHVDVDRTGDENFPVGKTPLLVATFFNVGKAITKLVDRGANTEEFDCYGRTPLQLAALLGLEESCKVLLQKGANIDAQDKWNGNTALTYASITDAFYEIRVNSQIRIVKMLLEAGANTTITNHSEETAYEHITKCLIRNSGNPDEAWLNYQKRCGKIIKTHELQIHLHSYKLPTFLVNFFVFLVFALHSLFKKQNHYKM